MAVLLDDLRTSGHVPCSQTTTVSAYSPTQPSVLDLLENFEGWGSRDGEDCSNESLIDDGDYPPSMLEPTPLNIPDGCTVAKASSPFYVVKELALTAETISSSLALHMRKIKPRDNEAKRDALLAYNDVAAPILHNKHPQDQSDAGRFRNYQSLVWKKRFNDLLEYHKRTVNSHIALTYNEDPTLARWVKRQRYQYKAMKEGKHSTMTEERVKALEDIGFVWDSQGTVWRDRLIELMEFKRIHKHCNVPSNHSKNPSLAVWVKCQRRQYKLYKEGRPSTITSQRISALERIGFRWLLRSYHCKGKNY